MSPSRAPLAPLDIDLLELRERVRVADGQLEDALERAHRVREVAEPLRPQVRDLAQDHDALFVGHIRCLRLLGQHGDQVVPPAERPELRRELVGGSLVVRIDLEDRVVGVDHHHVELQPVAIDLDDLVQALDATREIGLGEALDLFLHQVEQRVPLLGLAIQPRERDACVGGARLRAQVLLPGFDRLLGVVLRLGELRDLEPDRARMRARIGAGPRGLLDLAQHREQLRVLALRGVVRAIKVERGRVRGVELANAAEVLLRLVEVADVLPQHHRDLQQHPEVFLATRLERGLVGLDQRGPVLRGAEHLGDRAQGLRLGGIEHEHPLDRGVGTLGGAQLAP